MLSLYFLRLFFFFFCFIYLFFYLFEKESCNEFDILINCMVSLRELDIMEWMFFALHFGRDYISILLSFPQFLKKEKMGFSSSKIWTTEAVQHIKPHFNVPSVWIWGFIEWNSIFLYFIYSGHASMFYGDTPCRHWSPELDGMLLCFFHCICHVGSLSIRKMSSWFKSWYLLFLNCRYVVILIIVEYRLFNSLIFLQLLVMPILEGKAVLYSFVSIPDVRIGVAFGSGGSQSLPATELPGVSNWLVCLLNGFTFILHFNLIFFFDLHFKQLNSLVCCISGMMVLQCCLFLYRKLVLDMVPQKPPII